MQRRGRVVQKNLNSPAARSRKYAKEPTYKSQRIINTSRGSKVATTTYDYNDKPYLKAVTNGLQISKGAETKEWTLVKGRRRRINISKFLFVGNLLTKASAHDIWTAAKGDLYFSDIFLPVKRDINNNRFAFLRLKSDIEAATVLRDIQNTKLFGRFLRFALAHKSPPPHSVGHRPNSKTNTDKSIHTDGTITQNIPNVIAKIW